MHHVCVMTEHSLDEHGRLVEVLVDTLQVLQQYSLLQHALVERHREPAVDELAVEQGLHSLPPHAAVTANMHTHHGNELANELEVSQVIRIHK